MAFVQGVSSNDARFDGGTGALPGNATAGNTVLVYCSHSYAGCPVTLDDSQGNTYTRHAFPDAGIAGVAKHSIFSAPVGSSAALTVTFHMGCGTSLLWAIEEHSGVIASPFDQTNLATNTTSPSNAGSVTPTTDGQLIAVFAVRLVTGGTWTAISPFTKQTEDAGPQSVYEDYIQPTAGAITPTMTTPASVGFPVDMVVATFKMAALAGQPTMRRFGGVRGARPVGIGRTGEFTF